jgi:pyochelin biosynthesis protein PchC
VNQRTTGDWLRRLRPVADPWIRLVCFPHAGGTAAFYRSWRDVVPPDVELYAVQYPGRLDRIAEPCIEDMDAMADAVTSALAPLLDRPLVLFGHSLGAVIAFETARCLQARWPGTPTRLVVSGRPAPDRPRPGVLHLAPDAVLWNELSRLNGTRPEVLAIPALREMFLPALRSDYRLVELYRPRSHPVLRCPLTVLLGDCDDEVDPDQARLWAPFTRAGFSMRVFPGDHFYLIGREPELVDEILRCLAGDALPRRLGSGGPATVRHSA